MTEQKIHQAIAEYLDMALPPGSWHSAIDPSAKVGIAGALLKARGGKAGIPDHIVLVRGHHPIFFEVKTAKGKLQPVQEIARDNIVVAGAHWFLVRSIDDVETALRLMLVGLRATTGRLAA